MEIKDDCFHLIDGQFNCRSCGLKQTKLNVLLWTGDFNGRKGPKETRGSQSQYCPDCGCIFGCPFPEGDRVRRCVECADCYRQHEEEEFLLNILVQCTLPSDLGLLCLAYYSMSTSTSFMPDTTPKGFWRLLSLISVLNALAASQNIRFWDFTAHTPWRLFRWFRPEFQSFLSRPRVIDTFKKFALPSGKSHSSKA